MKKTLLYTLATAMAVGALAETAPLQAAENTAAAPRSVGELRLQNRSEAMTAMTVGDLLTVANRRDRRGKAHKRRHDRSAWCSRGRWYGKRCYYTPRGLRPFRQG